MPILLGFLSFFRLLVIVAIAFSSQIIRRAISLAKWVFLKFGVAMSLIFVILWSLHGFLTSLLAPLIAPFPTVAIEFFSILIPSNFTPCVYAILAAKFASFVFHLKHKFISYLSS